MLHLYNVTVQWLISIVPVSPVQVCLLDTSDHMRLSFRPQSNIKNAKIRIFNGTGRVGSRRNQIRVGSVVPAEQDE